MDSSKISSSSSSSSENHVARGLKADPRAEELVAIGDGVTLQEHQHPQTERRTGRQPLAPVQSSKKRKRERPSVDGDEYYEEDTHNNENKKPRVGDCEEIVLSSDEDDVVPLPSPPSIDSILSPWEREVAEEPTENKEHSTPHSNRRLKKTASSEASSAKEKGSAVPCYVSPSSELRPCPLPNLSWADPQGVWKAMCRRDGRNLLDRHPNMLDKHPGIMKKMRAILLDWLIEVCEVYKLHRETYHLAMDYLDRYLSRTQETCKTQLQLIGITCLFIAAKMEEIYPPKIAEFAYVTDSACDEADIQMQELGILQVLGWKVNTITAIGWLGVYLQVDVVRRRDFVHPSAGPVRGAVAGRLPMPVVLETPDKSPKGAGEGDKEQSSSEVSNAFEFPQFSGYEFTQVAQLMDLCSLDVDITHFPYSVVAAAAICHVKDRRTALAVSGLSWEAIADCAQWMEPFYAVILEDGATLQLLEQNEHVAPNYGLHAVCPHLTKDDSYKIQVHTCNLDMFDKVMRFREDAAAVGNTVNLLSPGGMLTPPASSRKSLDVGATCAVSGTKPT